MTVAADAHVYASVRRASLTHVPLVLARVEPAAEWCGYRVALYGSTLRHGQGRDFDLVFFPFRISPVPEPAEAVRDRLIALGMVVLDWGRDLGRTGLVGTLDGFALDITIFEGR